MAAVARDVTVSDQVVQVSKVKATTPIDKAIARR